MSPIPYPTGLLDLLTGSGEDLTAGNTDDVSPSMEGVRIGTSAGDIIGSVTGRSSYEAAPRTRGRRIAFNAELCTESLGFESMDERIARDRDLTVDLLSPDQVMISSRASTRTTAGEERRRRRKDKEISVIEFPPILTTLDVNGRSRFDLSKVKDNGRFVMSMERNKAPQIMQASAAAYGEEEDGDHQIRTKLFMKDTDPERVRKRSRTEN